MNEKKKVLIVDDDPDYILVVQTNLEEHDFAVETACNGGEALEKVKANPPDAIILDVMMPEMDGYSVCAELKADKRYTGIPIIMLTAVASKVATTRYSHQNGMTLDAEAYIPKPASPEEIIKSLKHLLKL